MFCPACGNKNPDDAKFCMECGRELSGEVQARRSANPVVPACPQCRHDVNIVKVSAIGRTQRATSTSASSASIGPSSANVITGTESPFFSSHPVSMRTTNEIYTSLARDLTRPQPPSRSWLSMVLGATKNPKWALECREWYRAMERWYGAYYCTKHDIVFVPEIGEVEPPGNFSAFLKDGGTPTFQFFIADIWVNKGHDSHEAERTHRFEADGWSRLEKYDRYRPEHPSWREVWRRPLGPNGPVRAPWALGWPNQSWSGWSRAPGPT